MAPRYGRYRGLEVYEGSLLLRMEPEGDVPYHWVNPYALCATPRPGQEQVWVYSRDMEGFLQLGNWSCSVSESRSNPDRVHQQLW